MTIDSSGFEEVDHTADLSLKIWGQSINDLFFEALSGLYHIACVSYDENAALGIQHQHFEEDDIESLLVSFLSEWNYRMQFEQQFIKIIDIEIDQFQIDLNFQVYKVIDIQKEIKAVTFHNLEIIKSEFGFSAFVVFDV